MRKGAKVGLVVLAVLTCAAVGVIVAARRPLQPRYGVDLKLLAGLKPLKTQIGGHGTKPNVVVEDYLIPLDYIAAEKALFRDLKITAAPFGARKNRASSYRIMIADLAGQGPVSITMEPTAPHQTKLTIVGEGPLNAVDRFLAWVRRVTGG